MSGSSAPTSASGRCRHFGAWRAVTAVAAMVGSLLRLVGLPAVLCPLADAAISRRAEFAADRFAADIGLALELAAALHALNDGRSAACG